LLVRVGRIELPLEVSKTPVMPLHYTHVVPGLAPRLALLPT
jgi:hypothetical protein